MRISLNVTQLAFHLLAGIIGVWLVASLYYVNIEFDDGYATIANSQYLLGFTKYYFWQRGPLMAAVLAPAELLATNLGLHPLDVRPHHAVMIVLHWVVLVAVWSLLQRRFGARPAVLLAFLAALPTVVFFSYAPFISHDLFPGLLVVLMLRIADKYSAAPTRRLWLALMVIGMVLALIKQTYALVWVAVIIAEVALCVRSQENRSRVVRKLLGLFSAAATGAVITWCIYGYVLADSFPDMGLLLRPWQQISAILGVYQREGPIREIIYQWVYIRNLSAYGVLAMTLVIPGVYLSFVRGDRLQQRVAIAWLVLFTLLNVIAFKEVRYLACLAPLTAIIIVPAIDELLRLHRTYAVAIVAILLFDVTAATSEALRLREPYYLTAVTSFLDPLPTGERSGADVVMTWNLSFVSPEPYAFFGDRYHRITHLGARQLSQLYRWQGQPVREVGDARALDVSTLTPGTWLIFVNDVAARAPPLRPDNKTALHDYFLQVLARAESLHLRRVEDNYLLEQHDQRAVMLLPPAGSPATPIMATTSFSVSALKQLLGQPELPDRLKLTGFRVYRLCDIHGCRPESH